MRILYLVHQFFPEFGSGTERVTLNLARAMQHAGHHVQVLACAVTPRQFPRSPEGAIDGAEQGLVDGVGVTLLPHGRLPARADTAFDVDPELVAQIERWLQRQRFDLVHVMHTMRMGSAVAAASRVGLPLLVTLTDFFTACVRINLVDLHGQACAGPEQGSACARKCLGPAWSTPALEERYRHARSILEQADARVVPSAFVEARCRAAFPGLDWTRIAHGVDLVALMRGEAAPRNAGEARHIGFVGSLIPGKGAHLLLQALALRPALDLRLSLAGGFHGDAAYEASVHALAAADPRVRLLGRCSAEAVATLMKQLDLLCLPSLVPETYSLVLHEAAALGVPAMVSARGAPGDAVAASGAGVVVAADSPAAWAQALEDWNRDAAGATAMARRVPLPPRVEEEAFFYESLYRRSLHGRASGSTASP
jgi:glycosyltransferase involved in cell wall biosynthesis